MSCITHFLWEMSYVVQEQAYGVQRENDRGSTEQITSLHSRKMILKLLCKGRKMTVPLNASTFHFSFHSRALSPGFIIGNGESQGTGARAEMMKRWN